jgi:serine/threonine-protein kinase
MALFDRMLRTAFGNNPPNDLAQRLGEVKNYVLRIGELRNRSLEEQRALQAVEKRGKEGRARFGNAVETLGVDLSAARDEQRGSLAAQFALVTQAEITQNRMRSAQAKVKEWEERASGAQPLEELAKAYRRAADAVEGWCRIFAKVREADERATAARKKVEDRDFQINQLRSALANQEQGVDKEAADGQARMAKLGSEADALEQALLETASRFCDPLRRRPDMAMFFAELEGSAGTSVPPPPPN